MSRPLLAALAFAVLLSSCTVPPTTPDPAVAPPDDAAPPVTADVAPVIAEERVAVPDVPTEVWPVVVYGASSGGVGAAVGAARSGVAVLLLEPSRRPGGMLTNGVTADLFRRDASSGLFDDHRTLVAELYDARGYGGDPTIRDGLFAEPDVALEAVHQLLDAEDELQLRTGWWLTEDGGAVELDGDTVVAVTVTDGTQTLRLEAATFIDATAEGDLLGAAGTEGADWVVGREGRAVYDERNAPEETDRLQQAYNYRLTVQVDGRTDYEVPTTYDEDLPRYRQVDTEPTKFDCVYEVDGAPRTYTGMRNQRCLVDAKMDLNIDLVGFNHDYLDLDRTGRAATEQRLADFALGWLHYLRTERGMVELGLPVDDYLDNDGLPSVLYVREGRRAVGKRVFTEHDAIRPAGDRDARLPLVPTSVAIGDYGLDSHCVGPRGAVSSKLVACDGEFWVAANPYQVPFEVMVPVRLRGLLVPVPVSASHVGYSTLRMEPVRANLGFAAGIAAATAYRDGTDAGEVDVAALQQQLVSHGQALIYLEGLDRHAEGFAAAQLAVVSGQIKLPASGYTLPDTATVAGTGGGRTLTPVAHQETGR